MYVKVFDYVKREQIAGWNITSITELRSLIMNKFNKPTQFVFILINKETTEKSYKLWEELS